MKPIKTIAMIYREVGTCGGIQRGASFQVRQFVEWGYKPVVLTEKELGCDPSRADRLEAVLREKHVDAVIEHDAYETAKLGADLAAALKAGVPIIVFWHSVFSWMVASGVPRMAEIAGMIRQADAVIALSRTDEAFFRMLGCRAMAIPYRDADIMEGFTRREFPHRIVWLGRLVDLKRPIDAIRILGLVRQSIRDAELVMLGDGVERVRRRIDDYLAEHAELKDAVRLEGFQRDVRPYLESSGVGLVTSRFEGFCHSIVEMKMASLPVVSYSMPYLPTLEAGTGAVVVPQGDVEAAAREIVALFESPDESARLGMCARQAYEKLRSFDERGAYERLFAAVGDPSSDCGLEPVSREMAGSVISTLMEHGAMGCEAAERRGALATRKRTEFRLGGAMLSPVRKMRRLFGRDSGK